MTAGFQPFLPETSPLLTFSVNSIQPLMKTRFLLLVFGLTVWGCRPKEAVPPPLPPLPTLDDKLVGVATQEQNPLTVAYVFDDQGKLIGRRDVRQDKTVFESKITLDSQGRPLTSEETSGTQRHFIYRADGLLEKEIQIAAGRSDTVRYEYDVNQRVTRKWSNRNGTVSVEYFYDTRGNVNEINSYVHSTLGGKTWAEVVELEYDEKPNPARLDRTLLRAQLVGSGIQFDDILPIKGVNNLTRVKSNGNALFGASNFEFKIDYEYAPSGLPLKSTRTYLSGSFPLPVRRLIFEYK